METLSAARPHERPPQFRLRTLFVLTVVGAGYFFAIRVLGPAAPCLFYPVAVSCTLGLLWQLSDQRPSVNWLSVLALVLSLAAMLFAR